MVYLFLALFLIYSSNYNILEFIISHFLTSGAIYGKMRVIYFLIQ